MPNQAWVAKSGSSKSVMLNRNQRSTRKKVPTIRKWYRTCIPKCVKAEKNNETTEPPPSARIRDFLAGASPAQRHSMLAGKQPQHPPPQLRPRGPQPPEVPKYLKELPFQSRPSTSLSRWFEISQSSGDKFIVLPNEVWLESTLPESMHAKEWEVPSSHEGDYPGARTPRQPGQVKNINTPDDFAQFTSDLHSRTELESHSVSRDLKNIPPNQGRCSDDASAERAEVAPGPVVCPIDLTSTPANAVTHAAASSLQPAQHFQAYPGEIKVSYILPQLQAGWASGVPPNLRAGHAGRSIPIMRYSTTNMPRPGISELDGRTASPPARYSWPLVDFDQEMFLNIDPAQAGRAVRRHQHPKHQEPRIPSMEFSKDGLEQEVTAMLDSLQGEKTRQRRQQVRGQEWRAVALSPCSPCSPFSPRGDDGIEIHEMEALFTTTADEHRRNLARHPGRGASVSPISPDYSGDDQNRVVSYGEYNWPRFSDVQLYQDPADEYSRRYRDQRREMRRGQP